MYCQWNMTQKRRRNMINAETPFFEYEVFPEATVVALNASLDDFKAQPIMRDGQPYVHFKEKTVKDCTLIDGCIYLHLGRVADTVMCDLIEKFQKLKKETKNLGQRGRLEIPRTTIII